MLLKILCEKLEFLADQPWPALQDISRERSIPTPTTQFVVTHSSVNVIFTLDWTIEVPDMPVVATETSAPRTLL